MKILQVGLRDDAIIKAGHKGYQVRVCIVDFDGMAVELVIARDVHKILGSKSHYSKWFKDKVDSAYGLEDGVDYVVCPASENTGVSIAVQPAQIDHLVTYNVAKELAMMERSTQGALVRRYFIALESVATEEQLQNAVAAAVSKAEGIKDFNWAGYFLSDPEDPNYANMNDKVLEYGTFRYTHATCDTINRRFGENCDALTLRQYSLDYDIEILDFSGTPAYSAEVYAKACGVDIVQLFVDYYGSGSHETTMDVGDLM